MHASTHVVGQSDPLTASAPASHVNSHKPSGADSLYFAQGTATLVAGTVTVSIPNIPAGAKITKERSVLAGGVLLAVVGDLDHVVAGSGAGTTLTIRSRLVALGVFSTNPNDTSTVLYTIWNP